MSVVLFNSSMIFSKKDVLEMGGVYPRIGIASIAAYLRENDVNVRVLDPEAEKLGPEGVKDKIRMIKPEIVGLPAYTEEVHSAATVAQEVKKVSPDIITVVGGPHPSAMPIETLEEFNSFDIAVFGEGEQTLLEIACGRELEEIKGIAYRSTDGKIELNEERPLIPDLNSLPPPAWQLYDLDKYYGRSLSSGFSKTGKHLELSVEGARGCPFTCAFCYRVTGRVIRFKSPKKVADEAERCIRFGATRIYLTEGTFGVNSRLASKVCEEFISRGIPKKITWSTGARVDIDLGLLEKMRGAGCNFIGFGVESGDQRVLEEVGKNITVEQSIKVFKKCRELGIKTEGNFILGLPYENRATVLKTMELAKKLNPDFVNFAILVPFPGTKIYEMACKNEAGLKIKTRDWKSYGKQGGEALEHQSFSHQELKKLQMKAYRSFYLRREKMNEFVKRLSAKRIIYGLKHLL